jgi:hypothetical protein
VLLAVVLASFGTTRAALAATSQRASLAGVHGVVVQVVCRGQTPAEWPDSSALASRVTLRLRETGVAARSFGRGARTPGAPLLRARLDAIRPAARGDAPITSFSCDLELEQDVRTLRRGPAGSAVVRAVTWSAHQLALESPEAGREELFETLDEEVDAFARDWLAAQARSRAH